MKNYNIRWRLSTAQKLSLSFLSLIFLGSVLLALPIMHLDTAPPTSYFDHLFTTVSMVCVTGLSVFPVNQVYNLFGQIISLLLMEIGGLGLVSLVAFFQYSLNKKLSFAEQRLLQSSMSQDSFLNLKEYLFFSYKITLFLEGLGALLLMIDFVPRFGLAKGIFNSLFLSVSAFCNAGFDNIGATSLQHFATNGLVNIIISGLIISGGLGFIVWQDVYHVIKKLSRKPKKLTFLWRHLSIHSRLMLLTTSIILSFGTFLGWLLEKNHSLSTFSFKDQILVSFFQAVTMRTAGFSTISYIGTKTATNLTYIFQMLIGGGPGGTAGGIKVTVFALLFLLFRAELTAQSHVIFQHRTIPQKLIRQTLTILLFFFSILTVSYLLLLEFEPNLDPFALFFEAASALATVGVSMNITDQLSVNGRLIIMLLMFLGRVGPITVLLSILQKKQKNIQYAECEIIIG